MVLLTFGEGWHNNHHAQSARHGTAWYQFDPNWHGILALQMLGVAGNVKIACAEARNAARIRPSRDAKVAPGTAPY